MKTLYVLRHAKAELGDADGQDFDRRLIERGQQSSIDLGKLFAKEGWGPKTVLSSSAARTKETIELLNKQLTPPLSVEYLDQLYLADFGELLSTIHSTDDSIPSAMLVGHNPGLHQLCLTLTATGTTDFTSALALKFPTCALAIIQLDVETWEEVAPGCGELKQFLNRHDVQQRLG